MLDGVFVVISVVTISIEDALPSLKSGREREKEREVGGQMGDGMESEALA